MKISKYLLCILKDFLIACGGLMIIVAMYLSLYSPETMNASLLWQIALLASAFTFYKYALVNTLELGKKAEMISFFSCAALANIMIIIWLWFFSTNTRIDKDIFVPLILVVFIVEVLVHGMMYMDGQKEAKQLNEKLNDYKKGGSE
ncbi:hypothetical protein PaeBR_18090 [Paenibacillus sp. BR2-3]|uniref:hypothetical protein n=1 Tax=Paenibacillus sp. BR2-3 TaxID=3048494 RepID=UPI003977E339